MPPLECQGGRDFGDVHLAWWCRGPVPGCFVRVSFRGQPYVEVRLDREHSVVPFSASTQEGQFLFAGQVRLDTQEPALILERLRWTGGREVIGVVLCPASHEEGGEPPPEETGVVIEAAAEDLFPYLFLRPWPRASQEDRENRFVPYLPEDPDGHPEPWLYATLAELRAAGDRRAMERTATDFLEGRPPWQGQALGDLRDLGSPMDRLSALDERLRACPDLTPRVFFAEVTTGLGMSWLELAVWLQTPDFLATLDRAWQSLFALSVLLGYDQRLLDELIRTVVLARLLQRVAALEILEIPEETGEPAGKEPAPCSVDPALLRQGVEATVVLPADIFPLPPAGGRVPPLEKRQGRVIPYAIGELELVRRRLTGYVLGEVSRIENVMRGEQKESTRRNLERQSRVTAEGSTSSDESRGETVAVEADFVTETLSQLTEAYQLDSTTQYGPPTEAQVTGSVTLGPNGDAPTAKLDAQSREIARSITSTAAQRLARKVWSRRATTALDEREETVQQRFDARHADANLRGIYRWVNKIYQAWVVNYGRRLVLEVFVPEPARAYLAAEATLRGIDLEAPVPPAELGLVTFRDVSRDPAAPTYYAALASRYGVTDVTPPPAERRLAVATFQSGSAAAVQEMALPEGYLAASAWVAAVAGVAAVVGGDAGGATLRGLVGRETFTVSLGEAAGEDGAVEPILLAGETGSLPVGVLAVTSQEEGAAPDWVLTVEVETQLGDEPLEVWQLATYRALLAGYERQRALYYEATGAAPSRVERINPLAAREEIRRALRQDVTRQLLEHARTQLGPGSGLWLGEPRYLQFFDRALEWDEMSYSFTVRTEDRAGARGFSRFQGEDVLFTAFLEASWARVLLPVSPAFSFAIPYFFASGLLWQGPDGLAPTHRDTLDLINELKQAPPETEERRVGEPWTVEVPTSMVLLQDSPDLPRFGRREEP